MTNPIEVVSKKLKIPKWWVEAIAIEYTDCRDFAQETDIWTFNFEKVSPPLLETAVYENHVILHDFLWHNINPVVFQSRMAFRMVSSIPAPIAETMEDSVPEGLVSRSYQIFQGNPIEQWDPNLSFSSHCQVFDEGKLYQWKIAEFKSVDGRNYGKYISDLLDLQPLDVMQQELQILRNPIIKPGEIGYNDYKEKVEDYYRRLNGIRHPILKQLMEIHKQKKSAYSKFSKTLPFSPPILSHFERFTVMNNEYYTKLYVEPIFYRGCYLHAKKAEELILSIQNDNDLPRHLDEIYQERATAIILGAACFEAFLNGLGFDIFPDIWKQIENLNIKKKCLLYYSLSGKDSSLFNVGIEPYKSIIDLFKSRNNLLHFKGSYRKASESNNKYITATEKELSREFVRDLPENLQKVIIEICNVKSTQIPEWLSPKPNLGWMN